MDPNVRAQLAGAFGSAADEYAMSRPAYPAAAVAWAAGSRSVDVLDLGAGSGVLTGALVAAGHRVVAAEPSEQMLGRLRMSLPQAPVVTSAAERLPFATASFDVVTVATAFHWFDAGPALAEMARVLRPGGRVCLLWNTRDETDAWTRELGELLRSVQPPSLQGDWGTDSAGALEKCDLFTDVQYAEFGFCQQLDRTGLRALVTSRSYVARLAPQERAQLVRRVDALYARHASAEQPMLTLQYRTQCWRATRRS